MDYKDSRIYGSYGYSNTLKDVQYGPGSVKWALPQLLERVGAKKALIITGQSLNTKTDVVRRVESILSAQDALAGTFWEIGEHAPIAGINRGIQQLQSSGADSLVSVGGGSPVDAAKAIIFHYQKNISGKFIPHIAIPTTLSAAEYSIGAGFTNEEGHKEAVSHQLLAPSGIILDAELTLATPERLWLSSGIRALDHSVENLYRPYIPHPLKVLCYSALADLFEFLPKSKADPTNVEYRQRLQIASWMSLWPIRLEKYSALGISHSLGHKLGATYHIGHGITSCLTLSPTVALQAKIGSESDKKYLAEALFYLRIPSTGSVESDIIKLSEAIDQLVTGLGLKTSLEECNVPRDEVPVIAERALGQKEHPHFADVVDMLFSIYPGRKPTN